MTSKKFEDLAMEERALEKVLLRRTCKEFSKTPIPDDNINLIIEAGRLAPNAGNLQNWRFIVIKSNEQKEKLGVASYNQRWIADAHILIVIASDEVQGERFYEDRGSFFNIQNCAMAAENMLIAAAILDVDSAFISGFDENEVREVIEIPDGFKPQGIVALGKATHPPSFPGKKPLNDILYFNIFGNKYPDMDTVKHDRRILDRIKKQSEIALPHIKSEVKENIAQGRFELLRQELELKNRQIRSLKEDLAKSHGKKNIVNIINIEGPWGYYILRRAKGIEYPASRKDLEERFKGFEMRRIPVEKIVAVIDVPIESHSDLLKKVKKALHKLKHDSTPEDISVPKN